MIYESDEEMYFHWWLLELEQDEIVSDIDRAEERLLSDSFTGKHVYTADYRFKVLSNDLLFHDINNLKCKLNSRKEFRLVTVDDYCEVEVKPDFDNNNMTRLFQVNRKWVYDKYAVYVNLCKVPSLFKKTFTPNRYFYTNKTNKPRKINYEARTYEEYKNIIQGIN